MKSHLLAGLLMAACALVSVSADAETYAYFEAKSPRFLIDRPADWQLEPATEDGAYVTLSGPTGVQIQLRTLEGSKTAVDEAAQDAIGFLKEHFSKPEIVDTASLEHRGMSMSITEAKGIDAEGHPKRIQMYFAQLDPDTLVEIWYAVRVDDRDGQLAAGEVIDSFRRP
jgi:hypothetical protein